MVNIIETLHSQFGKQNVIPVEKHSGVYLCEKKTLDEKIYQIIFIDTTDEWRKDDFSKYIESVVIDKYYQVEGYLQWNFYYYIITTRELLKANSLRKKEIESDETYTRKSILTEEEFTEWFKLFDNISKISKEAISNDLYTNWVNYLRDKNLNFVFNSEKYPNYKQPVEDYINGNPSEDIAEIDSSPTNITSEPSLKRIKKLELSEFRKYPSKRSFDLGNVNLIHGANATGKTSFYDAIELIITGELYYKSIDDNYSLQLTDDSSNIFKYPTKPLPYKRRDIAWYNSGVNRGNKLNGNFNRFNFFTSDAAFQLKQDDGKKENNLETIIADIALGREVNKLEERIISFRERFVSLDEYYLKGLNKINERLVEKNENIKVLLKSKKDPKSYKDALIKALKNVSWKTIFDNDSDDFIAKLDNEIQSVLSSLSNIRSQNISIEKLSKYSVENELTSLAHKQQLITTVKNDILKNQQNKQVYQKEIEKNNAIIPAIEELTRYFKHEQFSFLLGIEKNIQEKTIEQNRAKEIKELADSILSNAFFEKESEKAKTVNQLDKEIKSNKESLILKQQNIDLKIRQFEEGIEELSVIVSNIKSGGQSYLKINPKAENCPLCNTYFPKEELAEAIQTAENSFANSEALVSLKEELSNTSKSLSETDKQLVLLSRLKQLAFLIFTSNGLEKTLIEIQTNSLENSRKFSSLTESLIQLNSIQSQFINSGLSEERYFTLLNRISANLSINIKSYEVLDSKKQDLINKQLELTNKKTLLEKELDEKEIQLSKYFNNDIENEDILLRKLNILQEIENNFKRIEIYFEFLPNTYLPVIIKITDTISSVFETYKNASLEASQHNQVIDLTNKEIKKILAEIEEISPKQKRAKFANTELTKLLSEQSKNDFLSGYINENKTEIVSIFKLIHTPQEFDDINFNNDKINLLTNDGSVRTLSEISTGQRSALALSIFLSLNKKLTKGPNIIMFDDPVTYVDDMNVLSFFDYLRELVIKTNRQVFFATANDDLAFLFRKKFEFLDSDLVTHKLERKDRQA